MTNRQQTSSNRSFMKDGQVNFTSLRVTVIATLVAPLRCTDACLASGGRVSLIHVRPVRSTSGWMGCRIGGREIWSIEINGIGRGLLCRSVVVTQLGKQHPHALFLDRPTSHDSHRHLALAIKAFEGGVVVVSHDSPE